MKWRCLNDTFAYCNGIPEHEGEPKLTDKLAFIGGKCRLDLKTCGKYQLLSEQLVGIGLVDGNYRHTQVAKKKAKAKKGGKE